ncbi:MULTISPECIES: hypothetical protein [unclassified Mesorhizobium]|uniref:hypothetical protein n=1 Tax=unclassified Mesorhizobium TaxID=325217 RepID=UPI000FD93439|nr:MULTISPECIES: hypothetical protein [unclassified Mesorhizobium]TGT76711.1 hypothetical protein EN809_003650 [Mesorhizobium sp. M2E.F.Ca.ET.166.01.1.1]TGW02823.1 hypothetical protein EN797_003650 [Mesorhizobium sp. M2E.F.Ca.ET.154.01.1.1]
MFGRSHGYQPKGCGDGAPKNTPTGGSAGRKEAPIDFIGHLRRLELKPGDKFVLTCPGVLTREQHQFIQEAWRKFLGGDSTAIDLLILDRGMELGVVSSSGKGDQ